MRKIILLVVVTNILAYCQSGSIPNTNIYSDLIERITIPIVQWRSEWVEDTVFFKGEPRIIYGTTYSIQPFECKHDWAKENVRAKSYTFCSVMHDSRGCPDRWGLEEWICRNCLKWVRMKENRIIVEPPKSEFEQLKDKIKGLKK